MFPYDFPMIFPCFDTLADRFEAPSCRPRRARDGRASRAPRSSLPRRKKKWQARRFASKLGMFQSWMGDIMGGICGIVLSMKHQQMMFFCYNGIGIEWDVYESFKWDTMEIFGGKLMLQPEGILLGDLIPSGYLTSLW